MENKITVNYNITEHFKYEKLVCPCCKLLKITPRLFKHMKKLERLRQIVDIKLGVNSGYRCPKHNQKVGSESTSQHLIFATDLKPLTDDPRDVLIVYRAALSLKFKGVGLYTTFVHVDERDGAVARWKG